LLAEALAAEPGAPEREAFLCELLELPIPEATRTHLWATLVLSLEDMVAVAEVRAVLSDTKRKGVQKEAQRVLRHRAADEKPGPRLQEVLNPAESPSQNENLGETSSPVEGQQLVPELPIHEQLLRLAAAHATSELRPKLWAPFARLHNHLEAWVGAPTTVSEPLESALAFVDSDLATLGESVRGAAAGFARVQEQLTARLAGYRGSLDVRWADLEAALGTILRVETSELPKWAWPGCLPENARETDAQRVLAVANDADLRARIESACSRWEALDARARESLVKLEASPSGGDWQHALDGLSDVFATATLRRKASWISAAALRRIDELATKDAEAAKQQAMRIENVVDRLERLAGRIDPALLEDFHRSFDGDLWTEAIGDLEVVVEQLGASALREVIGLWDLRQVAAKLAQTKSHLPAGLQLQHPISRRSRPGAATSVRAQLVWAADQDSSEIGTIMVPVRLVIGALHQGSWELKVEPSEPWDFLDEPPTLDPAFVEVSGSSKSEDVKVEIRARKSVLRSGRLSFAVLLKAGELSHRTTSLEWSEISDGIPGAKPAFFPSSVSAELVRSRPLGAQAAYKSMYDDILSGERSLLLSAPRRFGKTTLLQALESDIASQPAVRVFGPFNALQEQHNPHAVWDEAIHKIEDAFSVRVERRFDSTGLPKREVFDEARRAAAAAGVKSLCILFDEAQAMFRGDRGEQALALSEALKDRLDYSWARREGNRSSLHFVLAGTTLLERKVGSNLLAVLRKVDVGPTIDEEQIVELLREAGATSQLQTSKEARERLAEVSCNILILRRLLEPIQDRLWKQGRTWFSRADVDAAVVNALQRFAQNGDADEIWQYVRDLLNGSDSVNRWEPRDCYVVAMAIANVGKLVRGKDARIDAATELLQSWSQQSVVERDRINEEVKQLESEGVLDRSLNFRWALFGEMLALRSASPEDFDGEEHRIFQNLGVPQIDLDPDVGVPIDQGGQASIRKVEKEGRSFALRIVDLRGETARRRFVREAGVLRKLLLPRRRDHKGYKYLPELATAGMLKHAPGKGAVMYSWIEGDPLSEHKLAPAGVARIGRALAEVLSLLEVEDVLHRDIKPANILITAEENEPPRPILIDFGLARTGAVRAPSVVHGTTGYIAPEVLAGGEATFASEVFSLGRTLMVSQARPQHGGLQDLLKDMTAAEPGRRPSSQTLRARFQEVLEFEDARLSQDWVYEAIGPIPPIYGPLRFHMESFANNLRLGLLNSGASRAQYLAFILEGALIAQVNEAGLRPKLQRLQGGGATHMLRMEEIAEADRRFRPLVRPESTAVGHLRNAYAHPDGRDRAMGDACRSIQADRLTPERRVQRLTKALGVVATGLDTTMGSTVLGRLFGLAGGVQA